MVAPEAAVGRPAENSMRIPAVLWLCGLVLLAVGASCSNEPAGNGYDGGVLPDAGPGADGGTHPDGGGPSLPVETACATLNAARCDHLQRCGLIGPDQDAQRDCVQLQLLTECGPSLWPARAAAGTVRYDGRQALACAEAWAAGRCERWAQLPEPCEKITSPNLELGALCYGGGILECRSGTCVGGTCPRRCRAQGEAGELCEQSADCAASLFCRFASSADVVGSCRPLGAQDEPCAADDHCGEGLYCGRLGLCTAYSREGQSCANTECASSLYCGPSPSGPVCVQRQGEGVACTDDLQCSSGLLCLQETGTCEEQGPLPQGAPCSLRQLCEEDLVCVGTRQSPQEVPTLGVCEQGSAHAQPCSSTTDCVQPLACVFVQDRGSCRVRQVDGESCHEARDCSVLSRCEQGVCVRLPRPAEPCPDGVCLFGICDQGVCGALGGPNAPCTEDAQCASERCVSGACLAACVP
jgi:hypothetical protein